MLIKTDEEIRLIKEGGQIMGKILEDLSKMCKPGVMVMAIDKAAEEMIVAAGGRPAFKGHKTRFADSAFPATICASLNEELVHGIPKKGVILQDGDIFTIDIGMEYPAPVPGKSRGYYTDTALTVSIGTIPARLESCCVLHKNLWKKELRPLSQEIRLLILARQLKDILNHRENTVLLKIWSVMVLVMRYMKSLVSPITTIVI
jgi:methionine aminopeptidase